MNQVYRAFPSTECVLLKATYDILHNADSGDCSVLVLLDLSGAFDTVDHDILIECLEHCDGIDRLARNCFKLCVKHMTFFSQYWKILLCINHYDIWTRVYFGASSLFFIHTPFRPNHSWT